MKLYGRKFADRAIYRKTRVRSETRDAILWNVDWDNRICNVKIQGSNELIAAHFPQNLASLDPFMKPGNAVRIVHRGGIRGFVEVIGHGMAIPTPVTGDSHPDIPDLPDGVISGMEVFPTDPPSMSVILTGGTYRINGIVYTLSQGTFGYQTIDETSDITMSEAYPPMTMGEKGDYPIMDETSDITMDELSPPMTMGEYIGSYELDAPPGGNQLRYDTFYVGIDGIIHYLKGTAASSYPTKPTIPADNVQIGEYILIWTGVTEITGRHIGMEYEVNTPSDIALTAIDTMPWLTDETNVTATIKDQYGWNITEIYNATLTLVVGSGEVWSGNSGYSSSSVTQQFNSSDYVFKYKRNALVTGSRGSETSPYLMVEIIEYGISAFKRIGLIDAWGNEINGGGGGDVQILIPAANVQVDWSNGIKAQITVDQDITFTFIGTPEMEKLILKIIQDGTGGWVMTLPANVKYGDEITAITVSTDINTRSYLGFLYDATSDDYDLVANVSGYI